MKTSSIISKNPAGLLCGLCLMAVLAFGACKKDPPVSKQCELKGKFEKAVCGTGLYDQYWIRLENGLFLQPCKSDVALLDKNSLYDGMPVKLSYTQLSEKERKGCNSMLMCLAWPGEYVSVRITCIEAEIPRCGDTRSCDHGGILQDKRGKLDGCGWLVKLDNGEVLDVATQIDENLYKDGDRVTIGYQPIVNCWNPCMAGTPVEITCIYKPKPNR